MTHYLSIMTLFRRLSKLLVQEVRSTTSPQATDRSRIQLQKYFKNSRASDSADAPGNSTLNFGRTVPKFSQLWLCLCSRATNCLTNWRQTLILRLCPFCDQQYQLLMENIQDRKDSPLKSNERGKHLFGDVIIPQNER